MPSQYFEIAHDLLLPKIYTYLSFMIILKMEAA
jgi:hypothetical protein